MARRVSELLTARESELMTILWRLGEATAEEVRQGLPDQPHDSTVRTLLRVLESKGYVRTVARSRPARYRPAVAQEQVQRQATNGLVKRFFDGSAEALVLRLLEDEQLTPDQLRQLRKSHPANGRTRG